MPLTQKLSSVKDLEKLLRLYKSGATFTVFDTETTGLSPQKERLIEIGAIKFNSSGIIDTFHTFVKPPFEIPMMIIALTHITDDMVCNAPVFADIADDFLHFIEGTCLIGHNAGFDVAFVNMELERCGKPLLAKPCVPAIDTIKCARQAFPMMECYKQTYLAEQLKIDIKSAHRADDDARVCMELFLKCMDKAESGNKAIKSLAAEALSM
ncbi:MAG: 3'-5' exonuclease [Treponemataceae bacterium]|nr:3'-5' exonuclease [Treponemataceae bacterium]